jgi:hypothetical protein
VYSSTSSTEKNLSLVLGMTVAAAMEGQWPSNNKVKLVKEEKEEKTAHTPSV